MKMNSLKLRLITLAIFSILFSVPGTSQNPGNDSKTMALISTMMGKIIQSPIPLMDAPPFNKKTNSIAPLIIKEEEKSIDEYREAVA
jgi:hypothetical protein